MMLRAFAEASARLGRPDYLEARSGTPGSCCPPWSGRPAAADVEGRPGEAPRLPGGPRDGRRRPPRAPRGDAGPAMARRRAAARRRDGRSLLGPAGEGFFDTGRDHEALVVRPRGLFDSAVPCGSSVAADVLLRLAVLTGEAAYERRGVATSDRSRRSWGGTRRASGDSWRRWTSTRISRSRWRSCGRRGGPSGRAGAALAPFWRRCSAATCPTGSSPGRGRSGGDLPLLAGKRARAGRPTAYVCERYACQAPTTEPAELGGQLDGRGGPAGPRPPVR